MLGCVTLLCCLGCWQLSREQQKLDLIQLITHSTAQAPLSTDSLLQTSISTLRFHPIRFQGTFLNERSILLDNKINNGHVGYHVLVPVALNDNMFILVNRGWISLGQTREQLPRLAPVIGEVTIEGKLDFAYRNPFIHSAVENNTINWPLRMQAIDFELLQTLLGKEIYPMLVNLNENSPYAFESFQLREEWLSPERHRGYAVQWFACALTLFFLYSFHFWRQYRKTK